MIIWGLKVLDLGTLTFFLVAWLGYAPFVGWRGRRPQMVGAAMIDHRRAWMCASACPLSGAKQTLRRGFADVRF